MNEIRKPPRHLKTTGRKWYKKITEEFTFCSQAELELLGLAAETLDRIAECRQQIKKEGLTTFTAAGGSKLHPAANLEKDSKVIFSRLIRELGLMSAEEEETRIPRISGRKK